MSCCTGVKGAGAVQIQSFPRLAHLGHCCALFEGPVQTAAHSLCQWQSCVLSTPQTYFWASWEPQARLSCSTRLGSSLHLDFPLSSPRPDHFLSSCNASSLLLQTPSLFTLDFQHSEVYLLPSAIFCSALSSVLQKEAINRQKSRLHCIRLI